MRRGERTSQSNTAATPTKIATTTCDITAAANSTAGSHGRLPVSSVYASAPSANNASASAISNEYSPASVLAMLPP